jgi:hypothetical protein
MQYSLGMKAQHVQTGVGVLFCYGLFNFVAACLIRFSCARPAGPHWSGVQRSAEHLRAKVWSNHA